MQMQVKRRVVMLWIEERWTKHWILDSSKLKSGAKTLTCQVKTPEDDPNAINDEDVASEELHEAPGLHPSEYIEEKLDGFIHEEPKDNTVSLTKTFQKH